MSFEDLRALHLVPDPFVRLLLDSNYRSYPDDCSVFCKASLMCSYQGFSKLQNGDKYLHQLPKERLLQNESLLGDIGNESWVRTSFPGLEFQSRIFLVIRSRYVLWESIRASRSPSFLFKKSMRAFHEHSMTSKRQYASNWRIKWIISAITRRILCHSNSSSKTKSVKRLAHESGWTHARTWESKEHASTARHSQPSFIKSHFNSLHLP